MGGWDSHAICGQCGHDLTQDARFCGHCGWPVPSDAAQAKPPAQASPAGQGAAAATPAGAAQQWPAAETAPAPGPVPTAWPSGGPTAHYPGVTASPGYPATAGGRYPATGGGYPGGTGQLPPNRRGQRFPWPFVAGIVVVLLAAGGGAAAVFLLRHHPQASSGSNSHPSTPASGSPSGTGGPAERHAAQALAALLARSGADRGAVIGAAADVNACGPHLGMDAATFGSAATSRQRLLSKLAALPGASALPAPMLSSLSGAWQESIQADQDFAAWAKDENSKTCVKHDSSDAHLTAATHPDGIATADKQAFTAAWNPLATRYNLPTYQWDQL